MARRCQFLVVCLSLLLAVAKAQEAVPVRYHYWIDQSALHDTYGSMDSNGELDFQIELKDLPEGIHHLFLRTQDSNGLWSSLYSWMFYARALPKNTEGKLVRAEYWIDSEVEKRSSMAITDSICMFSLDVSKLREGLHTLNYRFLDNEGMYSPVQSWLFLQSPVADSAKTVSVGEYWIDNSYVERKLVTVANGQIQFTEDAASLREGLHSLNYRVKDSYGIYSQTHSWMFFKEYMPKHDTLQLVKAEYWIDDEVEKRNSIAITDSVCTFNMDVANYREGLHTISYRMLDSEGMYTPLQTWLFLQSPVADSTKTVSEGEYWIDNSFANRKTVTVSDGQMVFTDDVAMLREGLHTINFRVKDSHGMYSETFSWMFLKNALRDTTLVNKTESLEYWFDKDTASIQRIVAAADSMIFTVNASPLAEGFHTLSYRVKDVLGNYSSTATSVFYKQNAEKATRISWYQYWWNKHQEKAQRVDVKEEEGEYLLTQLFEVPDYAKNDGYSTESVARLNILFGDDTGVTSALQVFDVEYPDEQPPHTSIEADREEASTEGVVLTWKANESKIADYNIYYSENGQPFVLWLPNTTNTTATFKGQSGSTYRFTVTARDTVGNREKIDENKVVTVVFKSN